MDDSYAEIRDPSLSVIDLWAEQEDARESIAHNRPVDLFDQRAMDLILILLIRNGLPVPFTYFCHDC